MGAEPCVDGNDILYADDLTGCSVAAASWPESDQGKWGAFMLPCGSTIEDANEFRRIVPRGGGYEGLSMVDSWTFLHRQPGQVRKHLPHQAGRFKRQRELPNRKQAHSRLPAERRWDRDRH
ncbi:hypothetical protein DL769_007062 [Monosporascus sp. CRB-8-3]|nr:hypothetical protein DL769_007062 [Monosporascus sp. CRB-8-3]